MSRSTDQSGGGEVESVGGGQANQEDGDLWAKDNILYLNANLFQMSKIYFNELTTCMLIEIGEIGLRY